MGTFAAASLLLCMLLVNGSGAYSLRSSASTTEDFISNPHYTHYEELKDVFANLAQQFPNMAKVFSIGKSVEGRELLVLEISENVHERKLGEPMVKYVANMHGDEPVGRELMIYLAKYLLYNYGKDPRVTRLVNNTDIFIMPSMNPDGFEKSRVGGDLRSNFAFFKPIRKFAARSNWKVECFSGVFIYNQEESFILVFT